MIVEVIERTIYTTQLSISHTRIIEISIEIPPETPSIESDVAIEPIYTEQIDIIEKAPKLNELSEIFIRLDSYESDSRSSSSPATSSRSSESLTSTESLRSFRSAVPVVTYPDVRIDRRTSEPIDIVQLIRGAERIETPEGMKEEGEKEDENEERTLIREKERVMDSVVEDKLFRVERLARNNSEESDNDKISDYQVNSDYAKRGVLEDSQSIDSFLAIEREISIGTNKDSQFSEREDVMEIDYPLEDIQSDSMVQTPKEDVEPSRKLPDSDSDDEDETDSIYTSTSDSSEYMEDSDNDVVRKNNKGDSVSIQRIPLRPPQIVITDESEIIIKSINDDHEIDSELIEEYAHDLTESILAEVIDQFREPIECRLQYARMESDNQSCSSDQDVFSSTSTSKESLVSSESIDNLESSEEVDEPSDPNDTSELHDLSVAILESVENAHSPRNIPSINNEHFDFPRILPTTNQLTFSSSFDTNSSESINYLYSSDNLDELGTVRIGDEEVIDNSRSRMTAGSPLPVSQSNQQWRTEVTRTSTGPNGETYRTETIRTNQQQQPETHTSSWRTESTQGGPVTTGTTSWRSEKRTTTTTEKQTIPVETIRSSEQQYRSNESSNLSAQNRSYPSPGDRHSSASTQQWRSESRQSDRVNPVDQRLTQLTRPESRQSNQGSEQGSVVHDTLNALVNDVEQTTEIIKRRQQQMRLERRQFQTEMEVTGRISVSPTDDWLNARLKTVSTDDLKRDLSKLKEDQRNNAVTDTLAALVYDVNATAEVLRRGSMGRDKGKGKKEAKEEIEYRLRLTPSLDDEPHPFPSPKQKDQGPEDKMTMEEMHKDYGVEIDESQTESLRRRARSPSETPRRTLQIETSPPPSAIPICAYCDEEIDGQILTALAPNSERAQKFHTYHFMCTYCQKALNMHGTYREHDKKPYCHDCFYKLYNGLLYSPDEHQTKIEKFI